MRSLLRHYILSDRDVIPVTGLLVWARWFETHDRRIRLTRVRGYVVSTVFVGIDMGMSWMDSGAPLVFETMAFKGGEGVEQVRASTYDMAVDQHKRFVRVCRMGARQLKRQRATWEYYGASITTAAQLDKRRREKQAEISTAPHADAYQGKP